MSAADTPFAIGTVLDLGTHIFTAEAIKRFAGAYDPQPFHLDEDAAEASLLGGLCASGWHTAAVAMRLNVEARRNQIAARLAAGQAAPDMGPSPGIRDMRWPKPVFAGEAIRFTQTITGRRASATRTGWEIVTFATEGVNEAGETVFSFEGAVFAAGLD